MEKDPPPVGFDAQPPPYSPPMNPSLPVPPPPPPQQFATYTTQSHHHFSNHQQYGHFGPEVVLHTQTPGTSVHIVTTSPRLGPNPVTMICASCRQTMTSRTIQEPGTRTHMCALILCIIGCWCCAPCVYCSDSCLDVKHYCSNCNAYQGAYLPNW